MFPYKRPRRLRKSIAIRDLVEETKLHADDFIVPLFIIEGIDKKEEIASMPGYYRMTLDYIEKEVVELWRLGLKSVLLFVKVNEELKDNTGLAAIDDNGLMQKAIKAIKLSVPEMYVMTDVALDPFSSLGHDGIVSDGKIANDASVDMLTKMALSHAKAGADMVAPSDMMDGRIGAIREILEDNGYSDTGIMSYSAKYASAFYGPFRDALDSAPVDEVNVPKDKKTYQMNPANRKAAVTETLLDIEEGADIVMVKPGIAYLDIVRDLANTIEQPIAVYQVSGEYAMIKAAAEKGWLDHDAIMMEQLIAIKRAGASLIASYFAKDVVKLLN